MWHPTRQTRRSRDQAPKCRSPSPGCRAAGVHREIGRLAAIGLYCSNSTFFRRTPYHPAAAFKISKIWRGMIIGTEGDWAQARTVSKRPNWGSRARAGLRPENPMISRGRTGHPPPSGRLSVGVLQALNSAQQLERPIENFPARGRQIADCPDGRYPSDAGCTPGRP